MKNLKNIFAFLLLIILLASCGVSKDEKAQRRANAFDLEGVYDLSTSAMLDSASNVSLEIRNETDRSNVYSILTRSNFTKNEEAAFDRVGISLNDVEKFRTRFQFGTGKHNGLEGGENISDDMGNSSRVYISTNPSEEVHSNNSIVDYSLIASISKSDFILKGKIILTISTLVTENNVTTYKEKERVEIPFTAKNQMAFYRQFMGTWAGIVSTDNEELNTAIKTITLKETSYTTFEISPARNQFTLDGELFKLNNSIRNVVDLSKNINPEIQFEFVGNKGTKIEIMSNIYSLGLYVGTIAKYDVNRNVEQTGSFQFKRN